MTLIINNDRTIISKPLDIISSTDEKKYNIGLYSSESEITSLLGMKSHLKKCSIIEVSNANMSLEDTNLLISSLCTALESPGSKITKLSLAGNKLDTEAASNLASALKHPNCKVTHLNLAACGIGVEGVSLIVAALKNENCKVDNLNLASNSINDEVVMPIAEVLRLGKINVINLGFNKISDKGGLELSEALKAPACRVTEFYVGCNNITPNSADSIFDNAQKSPTLTTVSIASSLPVPIPGNRARLLEKIGFESLPKDWQNIIFSDLIFANGLYNPLKDGEFTLHQICDIVTTQADDGHNLSLQDMCILGQNTGVSLE